MVTTTTDEYWSFNGVALNTPYWNVSSFGGSRQDAPLFRGQNYPLAYRAGQLWRPKQPDQRTITLAMWAAGVDQTSLTPAADQRLAFNNNFQQLRSMFWQMGNFGSTLGFLTRRWYLTQNGTTGIVSATAQVEVAGTMQPTMAGRTRADFSVDFLLADPFFYGTRQTVQVGANSSQTVLNLGDAPVGFGQSAGNGGVPFTIQLNGPLTTPIQLTNYTNGVSVTLTHTISTGQSVMLNILDYTAYDQSGNSLLGSVNHSGARPWMLLMGAGSPSNGNNSLALSTGNGGDTGIATLTYQPGYL